MRAKLCPTEPATSRAAGGTEAEVAQRSAPRAKERKKILKKYFPKKLVRPTLLRSCSPSNNTVTLQQQELAQAALIDCTGGGDSDSFPASCPWCGRLQQAAQQSILQSRC